MEEKIEQPINETNNGSASCIKNTFQVSETSSDKSSGEIKLINSNLFSDKGDAKFNDEELNFDGGISDFSAKNNGEVLSNDFLLNNNDLKTKIIGDFSKKNKNFLKNINFTKFNEDFGEKLDKKFGEKLDKKFSENLDKKIEEKLDKIIEKTDNQNLENNIFSDGADSKLTSHNGSIIGKFKDANTLLEAYNNLQAEFTRKSQKLAQLQKLIEENQISFEKNNSNKVKADLEIEKNNSNKVKTDLEVVKNNDDSNLSVCKENDFNEDLKSQDVISCNSDTEKEKEGLKEVGSIKEASTLPQNSQFSYNASAESELANKLNDPIFLDKYVLNNETVKSKIILDYLSNLNSAKTSPNIMSGTSPSVVFSPSNGAPKTIKEAGAHLLKMLK